MSTSGTAGKGGNGSVYDQSAAALSGAGGALQQAHGLYSMPGSYTAATPTAVGYNPAMATGTGYNPSLMTAASAADPKKIASGMGAYFSPYIDTVVNNAATDIGRMEARQQAENAAKASSMGAFGGSRHGIVEALTASEAQKNIGDLSGQLRHQGYTTAAGLSAQDIANLMQNNQFNASLLQQAAGSNQTAKNAASAFTAAAGNTASLANQASKNAAGQFTAGSQNTANLASAAAKDTASQFNLNHILARAGGLSGLSQIAAALGQQGFDIGNEITGQQAGAGQLQQQLIQQIFDRAAGQYDQFMGMPQNLLNLQLSALGMNPMTTATTTTGQYKPGMLDWASLIGQTATGIWGNKLGALFGG